MYSDDKHKMEVSIQGEGIELKKIGFFINDFGGTHYRFQERGEINRFACDISVYNEVADFAIHTWDKSGKHVELFHEPELHDGASVDKEADVDIDGKVYHFRYTLRYFIEKPSYSGGYNF